MIISKFKIVNKVKNVCTARFDVRVAMMPAVV
jgi:hypothetical protein